MIVSSRANTARIVVTVVAFALFVVVGSFPVHGQTLQVTHELGTTDVPLAPERVVVFDFGVLDSLDRIGLEKHVIGLAKASVPSYLAKFEQAQYENIGTLKEPDYEAINALKPELIIISGRQSLHYDELSHIAPTIYMGVDHRDYVASMENNIRTLGRIFQVESAVERELAALAASLTRVRTLATDTRALVLLVTGGRANAYGPGSRYGFVHDELGLTPVDPTIDDSTHGQSISWEYVLVHDPDLLLVIDRDAVVADGAQTAKQVVENELVKLTTAYETGNITYLDPGYWYLSGGGLTSFGLMVEDIEEALLRTQR